MVTHEYTYWKVTNAKAKITMQVQSTASFALLWQTEKRCDLTLCKHKESLKELATRVGRVENGREGGALPVSTPCLLNCMGSI